MSAYAQAGLLVACLTQLLPLYTSSTEVASTDRSSILPLSWSVDLIRSAMQTVPSTSKGCTDRIERRAFQLKSAAVLVSAAKDVDLRVSFTSYWPLGTLNL